jgi:acetoin utilization deacetylase AcuC-like enzyme
VHTPAYIRHLRELARAGWGYLTPDTPVSAEIVEKAILVAGGTIRTARLALTGRLALHLDGGFHHAFADRGEGFCHVNDVAVAIRRLQRDGAIGRAAIIDCDLHQGNGNAELFGDDPTVFTFSIHEERNYPGIKPPSDLDVGLAGGIGDAEYLDDLKRHVPEVLDGHRPDLVLYLAGADPFEDDQLGRLALTRDGLQARDEFVLDACLARAIPVATVLAGGYALDTDDTVEIHCRTARAIARRIT